MLKDVQILETWNQPDRPQYYVLAGLNREKSERLLRERILALDHTINQNIQDARKGTGVLMNLRSLKRALRDLQLRQALNIDLQIVQLTEEGIPALYTTGNIQRELNDYLFNKVRVKVRIVGKQKKQIEQAVWDGLNQEGFIAFTDSQNDKQHEDTAFPMHTTKSDLLIAGETYLEGS